jgi:hypothetical protein
VNALAHAQGDFDPRSTALVWALAAPEQELDLALGRVQRVLQEQPDDIGAREIEPGFPELIFAMLHPRDERLGQTKRELSGRSILSQSFTSFS